MSPSPPPLILLRASSISPLLSEVEGEEGSDHPFACLEPVARLAQKQRLAPRPGPSHFESEFDNFPDNIQSLIHWAIAHGIAL